MDKEKRIQRFKRRNVYAQKLREQGDHKGAFSLKKINPKKGGPYKRIKIIEVEENEL